MISRIMAETLLAQLKAAGDLVAALMQGTPYMEATTYTLYPKGWCVLAEHDMPLEASTVDLVREEPYRDLWSIQITSPRGPLILDELGQLGQGWVEGCSFTLQDAVRRAKTLLASLTLNDKTAAQWADELAGEETTP